MTTLKILDTIGIAMLYGSMFIAVATPLVVLALSVLNFVRAAQGKASIVLRALAILVIWAVLTFVFLTVYIMIVVSATQSAPSNKANDLKLTVIFALFMIVYTAVGACLIYWVRRTGRRQA